MGSDSLFAWIHLSDIHVGHGDATHVEDQKLVLDALREDVARMMADGSPRPDAIFVTGDIAFSGGCCTKDEYTRAARWLTDLAQVAGLGPETVFVVPGNHDVQRTADKPLQADARLRGLRGGRLSVDAALKEKKSRTYFRKRQANYLKFAAGFAPACCADAETKSAQLHWRHTLTARGGLRVRIVGLNTALLAADEKVFDSDLGHLWLGKKQLTAAFTEPVVTTEEVVIVLSHHPVQDGWLGDQKSAAPWIHKKADLHLSGHVHEAASQRLRSGGGTDHVMIVAGAVHAEKTPHGYPARHGYSFGALVAEDGELKVRVWPLMWSNPNVDFRPDVDNMPRGAEYAEHALTRVRLPMSHKRVVTPTPSTRVTPRAPPASAVSIARLLPGAEHFVGRERELTALDDAWAADGIHIITIVAWGGAGKSSLLANWIERMRHDGWRGAAEVFGWSFYSQGARDDGAASADLFINQALTFFGDPDPNKGLAWERGERLAALVRAQRTLLILDGLEPLQEPETAGGGLRDPAMRALLRVLATSMDGLCVVSTRQPVDELADLTGNTVACMNLGKLDENDGAELLRLCGALGSDEECREVTCAIRGHALTMMLIGHYIGDALGGDVRRWREVPLGDVDGKFGTHARHVMEAYDRWFDVGPERPILRMMGLFDRSANADCVAALRREPAIMGVTDVLVALTTAKWNTAVSRLRRAGLVAAGGKVADSSLDAHPMVREYFAAKLKRENPEGFRAAHGRLYEHLRDTTQKLPDTVDGLQPLYQAVWHGCRSGRHQETLTEMFQARILRKTQYYSIKKLGLFGADLAALAGFFEGDWMRPVALLRQSDQAWVLVQVSFSLRALGRLGEAVTVMEAGMKTYIALSEWTPAALVANNLAELYISRGALREALMMANRGVEFAERSGNADQRIVTGTTRANVLHLLGQRREARMLFDEAERMQAARYPLPLLFSLRGRVYCDLLLDLGETEEVERRVRQTLDWVAPRDVRLDVAFDHLSFGCTLRLRGQRDDARSRFAQAIDELRVAGQQEYLASALVIRAAFLREVGDPTSARRDLDETLALATRGEMRLAECDARLEQARQALDASDAAAAKTALDAALKLVTECEYHRRDCDVALLEARIALATNDRSTARTAFERARAVAMDQKLRILDAELATVEAALTA